jgi:hypothetical protein
MRHYDVAERDRDRVTVIGTAFPLTNLAVNMSVAAGRDDYPTTTFGLLDNKHRVYTAGIDAAPTEQLNLGVSYSYEDYRALSQSRQAGSNPLEFIDPRRNWSTDGHDQVHSVIVTTDVLRIRDRVDLRIAYDFNRARAEYLYDVGPVERTLPEESPVIPSTLPPPTQLPLALSETQRGTLDATYSLTERISLGLSYWYEQYRVEDFTLDAEANPSVDRGNALLIGYVYRPYTANTVWGRVVYRW